jgi:hypothetical protein
MSGASVIVASTDEANRSNKPGSESEEPGSQVKQKRALRTGTQHKWTDKELETVLTEVNETLSNGLCIEVKSFKSYLSNQNKQEYQTN